MKRIQEIWPKYQPNEELMKSFVFRDAWEAPLKLFGLDPEGAVGVYHRMPEAIAKACSEGVAGNARHTAGACLRFATDAKKVCFVLALKYVSAMNHMTACGQSGIELYMEHDDGRYTQIGVGRPSIAQDAPIDPWIEQSFDLPDEGMHTFCLFLPLYNGVKKLLVGFPEGANVAQPRVRRFEKPIAFYGSSITQGGCASKPGACYTAILGRRLDACVRNLGFSGSALAEDAMIEYLANQEMSAFVLDYDHNAPTTEHLRATHEKLFKAVRAAQPELPIVIISKPDFENTFMPAPERREVVRATWLNAVAAGDKKVWFVDGETLFGTTDRDLCTVDGCHPNTLGFLRMADHIEPTLRKALGISK